jgi:hypothetical protein
MRLYKAMTVSLPAESASLDTRSSANLTDLKGLVVIISLEEGVDYRQQLEQSLFPSRRENISRIMFLQRPVCYTAPRTKDLHHSVGMASSRKRFASYGAAKRLPSTFKDRSCRVSCHTFALSPSPNENSDASRWKQDGV